MNLFLEKVSNRINKYVVGMERMKFRKCKHYFTDQVGLEIGGPSGIFTAGQILPVYPIASRIDGVNFSTQTVWEHRISAGQTYNYESDKIGHQYILEASDLSEIADGQYDFLLSSHSLEHCANPIKALKEWQRVVRKGGLILIAVPDKRVTFDWRRSITSLEHLLEDYRSNIQENDQTHVQEILQLHDVTRDPGIENASKFMERSLKNFENRCLHHHVFDINLLKQTLTYIDMDVIFMDSFLPSLIALGKKK